jgi:hypothetical protein
MRTTSENKMRNLNEDSRSRKRNTREPGREQRGTQRGTERVSEFRGYARHDFDDYRDENYDAFDYDLERDNEERGSYGGGGRFNPYRDQRDYDEQRERRFYSDRRNEEDWQDAPYDDHHYDEQYYPENDVNWEEDYLPRGQRFNRLYRGRQKRRNSSPSFADMGVEEVFDRARNARLEEEGLMHQNRKQEWGSQRDSYGQSPVSGTRGGSAGYRNVRSDLRRDDWETEVRKHSNLGNSAPGARIMERSPKTRKKGRPFVYEFSGFESTGSRRRGTEEGQRQKKKKSVRSNYRRKSRRS